MTAPRIHIADRPPAPSGRARGRCGLWSLYFTSRAEEDGWAARCGRPSRWPFGPGARGGVAEVLLDGGLLVHR